jgi:hypothetical protein
VEDLADQVVVEWEIQIVQLTLVELETLLLNHLTKEMMVVKLVLLILDLQVVLEELLARVVVELVVSVVLEMVDLVKLVELAEQVYLFHQHIPEYL